MRNGVTQKERAEHFNNPPEDYEVYLLPEHWAVAFMNDDYTGFDYNDEEPDETINQWLNENPHVGYAVDVEEDINFCAEHDASDFYPPCDCVRIMFFCGTPKPRPSPY